MFSRAREIHQNPRDNPDLLISQADDFQLARLIRLNLIEDPFGHSTTFSSRVDHAGTAPLAHDTPLPRPGTYIDDSLIYARGSSVCSLFRRTEESH